MTAPGQRGAVLERAPHHAGVGDAIAVVGEDPHAEVVELAQRRELLPARATARDAAGDPHVARRVAAPFEHRLHDAGVVERRVGVRHAHDRGEASERGAARAGVDGLAVFAARFAEVNLDVDEPGRDDRVARVEHGRARRRVDAGADLGDDPVAHEHVGDPLAGLVDDAPALQEHHRVRQPGLPSRGSRRAPPCGRRHRWRPVRSRASGASRRPRRRSRCRGSSGRDA